MSLKNIWSLNVDETLAADKLKNVFNKTDYEVFFPLNSQMKDIDLLLTKLDGYRSISIQVKGSRTYPPKPSEVVKYGNGSAAWITISSNSIFQPSNKVSAYILVLHSLVDEEVRKAIEVHYLVVPAEDLKKVATKKKLRNDGNYHFFIWVDPKGKRAFDFNNPGRKVIDLSKHLNNWDSLIGS